MRKGTWKSVVAVALVCFVGSANRPYCDRRQPTLTCVDFSVTIAPGDCVDIENPCDATGDFSRVDGFRLCDAPDGIFVRTNRSRSGTTRQICAASNVAFFDSVEATFIYAAPGEFGEGKIFISTTLAFGVSVSASATTIDPGEQVALTSAVIAGKAPYSYIWASAPIGQIAPVEITKANPTVNPTLNTIYSLTVTDADGSVVGDGVSITVNVLVDATADPDTITAGGSSQLTATAEGGSGSYIYSWTPSSTLDADDVANPVASPTVTTSYTVDIDDGAGGQVFDNVTVYVAGTGPALQACFTTSPPNPTTSTLIEFNATCSTGNISEYRWWLFDPSDPDPTITSPNPITVTAPYDIPGTYDVKLEVVEQGTGNTASVIQQVTVVQ